MTRSEDHLFSRDDLVDAHHHLWDLGALRYPWLDHNAPPRPFGDHAGIKRNYTRSDYREDIAPLPIAATVIVEASCGAADPTAEARWLLATGDRQALPSVFVAKADLSRADIEATIVDLAAVPIVRGVRAGLAWRANTRFRFADGPHRSREPAFRNGVARVAAKRFSLDLIVLPEQLPEVKELALAFPDLAIVVNHLATAEPQHLQVWSDGVDQIKPHSNVAMKLSGLWSLSRGWDAEALRPTVLHAVNALGADRCMWGSNLPVEGLMCGPRSQISTLLTILEGKSDDDRAAIFATTARRIYRIGRNA